HKDHFLVITCMAQDFSVIPATLVSVECLFSDARHICTNACSLLKAETISELMCTKLYTEFFTSI
ncbi:hypothetical protein OF83DRAFT_1069865, partial [Amylostereum chailletii]